MRHERNFEIDQAYLDEAYVEHYPGWIVALVWLSVFLLGGCFWWGVIAILAR